MIDIVSGINLTYVNGPRALPEPNATRNIFSHRMNNVMWVILVPQY